MHILILLVSVLLSIFSTAVMAYITMATPIGPWIEPTLVLLSTIIFRFIFRWSNSQKYYTNALGLSTSSGAIGGILATGFGFAFPTLYFLDPILFKSWLDNPVYFILL